MTPEPNEQELIDSYKRVEAFLADPAVKGAIGAVNDKFIAAFRTSITPEQREGVFAQMKALDALSDELMAVMSRGQMAEAARTRREAQEEAARRFADRQKRRS